MKLDKGAALASVREARGDSLTLLRKWLFETHPAELADFISTAKAFIRYIDLRQHAILDLLDLNHLWDAQIVARSVLEALTKLLFIAGADLPERQERIREYWDDLAELNSLKQSEAARRMIGWSRGKRELEVPYMPLVLDTSIENTLKKKWPKSKRQKLEQKWSYTEMTKWLSTNLNSDAPDALTPLSWHYRMSSNLIHADESGVGIVLERESRTDEEIEQVETAHFSMLASDSVMFVLIAAWGLQKALNKEKQEIIKIYEKVSPTLDGLYTASAPLWTTEMYIQAETNFRSTPE